MDMSFYTSAVGAHQQQRRLDIHANNLANVNTYGFKARRPSFSVLMTNLMRGIDEDLRRGAGARVESAEPDLSQNGFWDTDRVLDYAIDGNGFFALMDPLDGKVTYTRDGSFTLMRIDSEEIPEDSETLAPEEQMRWYLSDGLGRYVLGTDGRPIQVEDPTDLGTLREKPLPVGVFDFINRNGFQSAGDNGFTAIEKNGNVMLGNGRAIQGCLELSNTDYAYELTKVIESQRSFQYALRMVQTSDEITSTVNNLRS